MSYRKIIFILSLGIFLSTERNAYSQAVTFPFTGSVQTWTVPSCTAGITITATGGGGGGDGLTGATGGAGATIVGTMTVATGDVLNIYTGQQGTTNYNDDGGAGGGGSFIYDVTTSTLLEVAGGGGGSYYCCNSGWDASTTITPTGFYGGSGEGGGGANATDAGGGGAGFLGDGATNGNCDAGTGGSDWSNGFGGGQGDVCLGDQAIVGGYGGGGGCGYDDGGGGGGYNGGGSGAGDGGGGGGSYVNGTMLSSYVTNTGDGTVTINYGPGTLSTNVVTNVRCNGGSTGSASASVIGTFTPYTYSWSPGGQTNATAINLSAGNYTITVTAACGGTLTASVTITQPNPVGVTTTVNANVLCNGGSNGKITANPNNGTAPYTYLWTPTSQTNISATGLTAGSYTVKVTDNCGQTATAAATITQPLVLTDSAYNLGNVLCSGGRNGSVGSLTTGGTRPYTYLWTPSNRTTDTIAGLTAGVYSVTVTDSHGCSTSSSAIVTQPTPLTDSIFVTASVLCNGQSNGSAGTIAQGGTSPYTYLWTPGGQTTAAAISLSAGTYTVSVHDNNGCSVSMATTITQPNVLTAVATAYANVICNGGSDGGAIVTPNGGTLPYTYSWAPGGSTTDSATGLSVGTYTVNVWDSNDCNVSTTVTITQPIALIVGAGTVINNLCNGDNIAMAVAYVAGGPAPYTYSWSNATHGDTATGLSVGTYTVNVTDINGCTGSAVTSVTQPTALSILLNSVPDDGSCTGAAWLQVTGGVSPYKYLWAASGDTAFKIINQCTGNYCCRVTDANGCYDNVCVDIGSYLGVSNLNGNGGIKIYPNPTNGQFTIENGGSGENSVIEIYNVLGESVYSGSLNAQGTTTVNIGSQPNGVYLYRVKSQANGTILSEGKLVLQK